MINKFRRLLIRVGKILPFIVCLLILLQYTETTFALLLSDFLIYDDMVIPNTPISFFIGQYFEYNLQMLMVLCIISIAVETCLANKACCVYLGVNLCEKSYFASVELYTEYMYAICVANIIVSAYFVYKGIKILTNK